VTESRTPVRRPSLVTITQRNVPQSSDDLPPKPWNVSAILSPFVALVCAPVGLCLGLIAAGRIGMGRQRGIGFAVAGIVIGSLIPVVVCVGGIVR
jgi:hypothetical protein